jgi:hypothetical protein
MLRHRPGMGLLVVVVALATIAIMTALAITPNMAQVAARAAVGQSLDRLSILTDMPTTFYRFWDDTGRYPGYVSHLSRPVTTDDASLCGPNYTNPQAGGWSGRYAGRMYPTTGTPLPIGMMQDQLEWDPVASEVIIVVTGVQTTDAIMLDQEIDGGDGAVAGRVRWGAADGDGLLTLRWHTAIPSC